MNIDLPLLLTFIGLYSFFLGWFFVLRIFKLPANMSGMAFLISCTISVFSLTIVYALTKNELMITLLVMPGVFVLPGVFSLIKHKGKLIQKQSKIFILNVDDYQYITQTAVPGHITVGQDFPGIYNYLYLPKTNEYILLAAQTLSYPHKIKVDTVASDWVVNNKDIKGNIYQCVDLTILDKKKTFLEIYKFIMKKILLPLGFGLAIIPMSYMLMDYEIGDIPLYNQGIMIAMMIVSSASVAVSDLMSNKIMKKIYLFFSFSTLTAALFLFLQIFNF